MISRKTALALSDLVADVFYTHQSRYVNGISRRTFRIDGDKLYDFLYAHNYEPWFCNLAKNTGHSGDTYDFATRTLKDFIKKLHTGESLVTATSQWTWEKRALLGQKLLHSLSEDMLTAFYESAKEAIQPLKSSLELDGYIFRGGHLLAPESDILDVREEINILDELYSELSLSNKDIASHHLELSEEHYKNGKWGDSISNSRKYLECVLQESASLYSTKVEKQTLQQSILTSPARVRECVEKFGLIDKKEREVVSSIYGLLSETGAHPYMAQNDQAHLLRQLALTISQFVLLRLQGVLQDQENL